MRKNGEGMLVVWEYGCTTPSICRGPWGDGLPGARKASNRCPLLWMFVKGVKQVLKLRSRRYRKVVVCTRQEATRLVDHGSSPLPLARTCRGADPTGSVSAVELGTTIQCPPKGAVSAGGRHLGGWRRGQPLLPRQIRVPTRHKTNMRGGWAGNAAATRLDKKQPSFSSTGCANVGLSSPWWLSALWHHGHIIFNLSAQVPALRSALAVEMLMFLCPPSLVVWLRAFLDERISRAGGRLASARALRGKTPAADGQRHQRLWRQQRHHGIRWALPCTDAASPADPRPRSRD